MRPKSTKTYFVRYWFWRNDLLRKVVQMGPNFNFGHTKLTYVGFWPILYRANKIHVFLVQSAGIQVSWNPVFLKRMSNIFQKTHSTWPSIWVYMLGGNTQPNFSKKGPQFWGLTRQKSPLETGWENYKPQAIPQCGYTGAARNRFIDFISGCSRWIKAVDHVNQFRIRWWIHENLWFFAG